MFRDNQINHGQPEAAIAGLPNETLVELIDPYDSKDILSLGQTSRFFRYVADSRFIWKPRLEKLNSLSAYERSKLTKKSLAVDYKQAYLNILARMYNDLPVAQIDPETLENVVSGNLKKLREKIDSLKSETLTADALLTGDYTHDIKIMARLDRSLDPMFAAALKAEQFEVLDYIVKDYPIDKIYMFNMVVIGHKQRNSIFAGYNMLEFLFERCILNNIPIEILFQAPHEYIDIIDRMKNAAPEIPYTTLLFHDSNNVLKIDLTKTMIIGAIGTGNQKLLMKTLELAEAHDHRIIAIEGTDYYCENLNDLLMECVRLNNSAMFQIIVEHCLARRPEFSLHYLLRILSDNVIADIAGRNSDDHFVHLLSSYADMLTAMPVESNYINETNEVLAWFSTNISPLDGSPSTSLSPS